MLLQHSKHETTSTKTTLDQRLEFVRKSRRYARDQLRHCTCTGNNVNQLAYIHRPISPPYATQTYPMLALYRGITLLSEIDQFVMDAVL